MNVSTNAGPSAQDKSNTDAASAIRKAENRIAAMLGGYPARSVVYYGGRGVEKTHLLNAIGKLAKEKNLLCEHIEVKTSRGLVKAIFDISSRIMQNLALNEKSFASDRESRNFDFSNSEDLTERLITLGRKAQQGGFGICFCIDELQCARKEDLESLSQVIHRLNQLRLPILFFCTGSPKILKDLGNAVSYAERLFEFVKLAPPVE